MWLLWWCSGRECHKPTIGLRRHSALAVNDEGRGGRAHGGAVSAVLDDLEDLRRGDDGGHRGGHLLGHPVKPAPGDNLRTGLLRRAEQRATASCSYHPLGCRQTRGMLGAVLGTTKTHACTLRSRSLGLAREGFLGGLGDVAAELAHVGLGDVLVLAVGAEDDPEPARHRRGGCGRMANDGARAEAARRAQGVCLFTAGLGRRPSVYRWSRQL